MIPFIVLSLVIAAQSAAPEVRTRAASGEHGVPAAPAQLFFGDVDGDALEDVFSVGEDGTAQLLHNEGDGRFEDVTLASGLSELTDVTFGLFADLDGDRTLDLYVGRSGAGARFFRNHGNASFEPLPLAAGVLHSTSDLSARVLDLDKDGALDLHVHTDGGDVLYRNTPAGFVRTQLGAALATLPGSNPLLAIPVFCISTLGIRVGHRFQACAAGGARILGEQGNTPARPALGFFSTNGVDDGGGGNGIYRPLANTMAFATVSTERMRITSGGAVGIGTASPTERLHVIGNILASGAITANSDRRFKTNVSALPDALARVLRLRGIEFDWRRDEFPDQGFSDARQVGFIAQEVREVVPEVVVEGSDGYLAIDYSKLTPLLVEALRTQNDEIEELRRANAELSSKVARLDDVEARVQRIEGALASVAAPR